MQTQSKQIQPGWPRDRLGATRFRAPRSPVPARPEELLRGGGQVRTDDPSIMSRVLLPTELRRHDRNEPPVRIELTTFSLPWKRSAD